MAKLFHVTSYMNRDKILKEGLTYYERLNKHNEDWRKIKCLNDVKSGDADILIDKYKPLDLPYWMEVNKCIYMTIYEECKKFLNTDLDIPYFNADAFGFIVNSEELDQSRLFVNDPKRNNIYMNIFENVFQMATQGINRNSIRKTKRNVEKFWRGLIPFQEYYNNPDKYPKPDSPSIYEVLYFGKISPNLLAIINDNIENDEILKRIYKNIITHKFNNHKGV
ncbi:hypothetical protein [Clostridium lundense]|uniref:hypothetical protein n=1 Tax=Clostridium lundense TaxID=319475 RepID=UPI0004897B25|nr:hypothetical protein [Clostridium lundense]